MSQSALPSRSLLPRGEEMMCPETVKPSLVTVVHPLSGPALVSPDTTTTKGDTSLVSRALPTLATSSSGLATKRHQLPLAPSPTTNAQEGPISPGIKILAPRSVLKPKASTAGAPPSLPQMPSSGSGGARLNKFVRRLHDMLVAERESGIVEWRRGLLVLHSTDAFAKTILPKYFNTRNFKTFRRQLNYYGFVHVRSFSTTGSTTTALWVNRELAKHGSAEIASVLMLKRVEPCEAAKTAEGRRVRKEMAIYTVEEDIGVSPKSLQMEQIRTLAMRAGGVDDILKDPSLLQSPMQYSPVLPIPTEVLCRHAMPPTFPKLDQKRQVVPIHVKELNLAPRKPIADVYNKTAHHGRKETAAGDDAADENISAANLLLMLSKGSGSSCSSNSSSTSTEDEAPSASAPGQF